MQTKQNTPQTDYLRKVQKARQHHQRQQANSQLIGVSLAGFGFVYCFYQATQADSKALQENCLFACLFFGIGMITQALLISLNNKNK